MPETKTTNATATLLDDAGPSSVELLDELESIIGEGRRVPFSANVVINEDEALELIDRARLGLPQELIDARNTVVDRREILDAAETEAEEMLAGARHESETLLKEARDRAERMVEEARRQADLLVAESDILKTANEQAAGILSAAEADALRIRSDSETYAREIMEALEGDLARTLSTVRRGLETLPTTEKPARRGRRREG